MVDDKTDVRIVQTKSEESAAEVADAGNEPEGTDTEKGNRLFLERVRHVPGVVHVEPFGGKTIGEQSFMVYVRDGDLDAEYGVYRVKGEVYDRYRDAQLRVELLEQSDIPEGHPGAPAANP
jgi:hypothetical protein